ncbi:uncharacterized protein [Linepithema humile]|uniref:uncharacterized protein n=1 Tax=Linepithema humile TaxID=83485 RepID=UPI000623B7CF|nr:PREDICTED: uncharacterized protein LOC105667361 [Linepithema humile]
MSTTKPCCISVTLMTRIIATYTMSLAILMINVLMSNFFTRKGDEDFFESVNTWAILGLNWVQIITHMRLQQKAQTAMICILIYIVLFLLTGAYLALGSISRRPKCAVPWMYLQMISIIDQFVAICDNAVHTENVAIGKAMGYIMVHCTYLTLSMYFWIVVQEARNKWYSEEQQFMDCETRVMDPLPELTNSSGLKSPSYLSQNFSMFESPRPTTLLPI